MDIDKVRNALNIAFREHNDLMIEADLPIGSKVIKEALDELYRSAQKRSRINAKLYQDTRGSGLDAVDPLT